MMVELNFIIVIIIIVIIIVIIIIIIIIIIISIINIIKDSTYYGIQTLKRFHKLLTYSLYFS